MSLLQYTRTAAVETALVDLAENLISLRARIVANEHRFGLACCNLPLEGMHITILHYLVKDVPDDCFDEETYEKLRDKVAQLCVKYKGFAHWTASYSAGNLIFTADNNQTVKL